MALTKIPSSLLDTSGGFDLQGNITLGDNEKIILGDSSDLQIYHNGSNSYIDDAGTGALNLRSSGIYLEKANGAEVMISAIADGAVTLYHDGSIKLATSSTGATVTGTLTVTGDLDITGDINSYNVTDLDVTDQTITLGAGQTEANSGGSGIIIDGSSASILWDETNTEFDINNSINVGGNIKIETTGNPIITNKTTGAGNNPVFRLQADTNYWDLQSTFSNTNDELFFMYNGSTKMAIDNSGNVGIGLTSPAGKLHIEGTNIGATPSAQGNLLVLEDTENGLSILTSSAGAGYINFGDSDDNDVGMILYDHSANTMKFTVNASERMRIDSSGRVGIGTTPNATTNFALDIQATSGGNALRLKGRSAGGNEGWLAWTDNSDNVEAAMYATSDNLIFANTTSYTERMRLNSTGLGIGTSSPTKTLSVKAPSGSNGGIDVFHNNGNKVAELVHHGSGDEGRLSLYDGGTGTVQIHGETGQPSYINSGNFGIGVSSPSTMLHMNGTGDMIRLESTNSGAGGAQIDMLHFSSSPANEDTQAAINMGGYYSGSSSAYFGAIRCIATDLSARHGRLEFYTRDDSSFPHHMQINHHGGIAIGENNAGYEGQILSVKSGTGDYVLYGESSDSNCGVSLRDNSSTMNIVYGAEGNNHVFKKDGTEKMQLTADGTLLLGQTSASSSPGILEITGTNNTMGTARITPNSNKGSEVSHIHYGSTGDWYIRSASTSGKVIINDGGGHLLMGKTTVNLTTGGMIVSKNDFMSYSNTLTDTGDRCVVWNRQSASYGDFQEHRIGNTNVGKISINSSGNMVYGGTSDYRLKENVNYTWDATTLLKQLKPCKFEWKSDNYDTVNQGFLAHEVQDIVPQAVMGDKDAVDSEGEAVHQQLDNSQLVPLLVKTIQELEARIATLEG